MPRHGEQPAGVGGVPHFARYLISNLLWRQSSGAKAINRVYLQPIEVRFPLSVDRIIIANSGVAAGNLRACIYADNGDQPDGGAVIVETAAIAMAGVIQKQELVIALNALTEGLYWLALNHDNAAATFYRFLVPWDTGGTLFTRSYDLAFGPFTDPCPVTGASPSLPCMGLRVASVP